MDWLISIDILLRIIFSKYILKLKFYKHHRLGLLLDGSGFLILTIINIYRIYFDYNNIEPTKLWIYILFLLPKFILYPLRDVISKKLLTDKFTLPHSLMFMRGIFNLFFLIILSIFIICFTDKIHFSNIIDNFSHSYYIISFIISIIFQFFKNFIVLKVIYIFTPQHICFLGVFNIIIDIVYQLFISQVKKVDFLFIVVCLTSFVIIIGVIIFNEIIIINKYGLQEGTKEGLLDKEKIEKLSNLNSLNDDDNDIELNESNLSAQNLNDDNDNNNDRNDGNNDSF